MMRRHICGGAYVAAARVQASERAAGSLSKYQPLIL